MPHFRSQETVDSALRMSDEGVGDRANAEIHGVAITTIRRWRRLYQRRGLPRGSGFAGTPCPRCDGAELDEAAYALLLGWYLGDGCIARARRDVFTLQIANDQKYPQLNQEIAETIRRVKPTASPCLRGGSAAVRIEARWKHWPCLFPQHGPGMKHRRKIELLAWQSEIVARYPESCCAGCSTPTAAGSSTGRASRTEGAITMRATCFTNESGDIRNILTQTLDMLGIPWRQPRRNAIAVSRKAAVEMLDSFVGPKA
ncbi:transcriptional regulator [Kribbella sp. NPDC050820]|uniref:transcriptional regulator n=1 Tax=Kribbella sp. NPDC050820 TaxID=3155408 RepID=UPI0033E30F1A